MLKKVWNAYDGASLVRCLSIARWQLSQMPATKLKGFINHNIWLTLLTVHHFDEVLQEEIYGENIRDKKLIHWRQYTL